MLPYPSATTSWWRERSVCRAGSPALLRILVTGVALAAMLSPTHGAWATRSQGPPPAGRMAVLDVPYISQAPALCGGAAAAMVLRYWGEGGVWDTDFAHLVDPETRGIRTTDLVRELRDRGARVLLLDGGLEALSLAIENGRPPIVLLRVGPDRYHYVIVVARGAGVVLYHDPADAPFRLLPEDEFADKWRAAGSWAAAVLPPGPASSSAPAAPRPVGSADDAPAPAEDACAPLLRDALDLAEAGDRGTARERLEAAHRICPEASAPLRELAALRFLDEDWSDAARLAETATSRDPGDALAWRILGTSRYLRGDPDDALRAWNRLGEPRTDLLSVPDLAGVRHRVVRDRVGIAPESLLTPRAFALARRRLAALPAARKTRLSYVPAPNGSADLTARMVAEPGLDPGFPMLVRAAIDALAGSRVRVQATSPTGGGELVQATWRWQGNRPQVALSLETPEPAGIAGILRLEAEWEAQTFAVTADAPVRETRRRGTATLSRWVAPSTRISGGLGIERWSSPSLDVVASAGIEQRLLRDHGAVEVEAATGLLAGGYTAWRLGTRWRTTTEAHTGGLLAYAGASGVAGAAPRSLWPGAGTGRGRNELLRAHPLVADGIVVGEAFGRRLVHGNAEGQIYPLRLGPLPLGVAAFADVAWADPDAATRAFGRWFVDVGAGLRLGLPGLAEDLRIDWAIGVLGGGSALSLGWQRSWN